MEIGKKIYELRKRNGLSQDALSVKLGVSRQTVSKWESGASKPDVEKIVAISKLFNVPTDVLLIAEAEPAKGEKETQATFPKRKTKRGTLIAGIIMSIVGVPGVLGVVLVYMVSSNAGDVTVFYTTSYISRDALLIGLGIVSAIGIGLLIYCFVRRKPKQ